MDPIDLSGLSLAELRDLINRANDQAFIAEQNARDDAVERKIRIANAVTTLSSLLGPTDAVASMDSIRGVLAYGEETIAQNPGQAVVLIIQGLEQLTATVLDLAKVVGDQ